MLDRITLHTIGNKRQEKNTSENISKCCDDKGQLVKLLSYHPTTAVHLYMKGGNVVDGFYQSKLRSITSNVMGWPLFLDFVSIENNEVEKEV